MSGPAKILFTEYLDDGDELEHELPAKFEVCPRCRGEGSHVNPSIDGNGISPEEFADDPDFEEAYFRGDYDVACHRCDGKRVIAVLDRAKAEPELVKKFDEYKRELADMAAEEEAERRMGA